MVVKVAAVLVHAMLRHELNNLQGAVGATDVGELDIGLERIVLPGSVHERPSASTGIFGGF